MKRAIITFLLLGLTIPSVGYAFGEVEINRKIHFSPGGTQLRPVSYSLLDEVIQVLKENRQIFQIEIQGHTDDQEGKLYQDRILKIRERKIQKALAPFNFEKSQERKAINILVPPGRTLADYEYDLSVRRAESIRNALIKFGINADRLTIKGYGRKKPIEPNKTKIGRAKNRRVQFVIVDEESSHSPVPDLLEIPEIAPQEEATPEPEIKSESKPDTKPNRRSRRMKSLR